MIYETEKGALQFSEQGVVESACEQSFRSGAVTFLAVGRGQDNPPVGYEPAPFVALALARFFECHVEFVKRFLPIAHA